MDPVEFLLRQEDASEIELISVGARVPGRWPKRFLTSHSGRTRRMPQERWRHFIRGPRSRNRFFQHMKPCDSILVGLARRSGSKGHARHLRKRGTHPDRQVAVRIPAALAFRLLFLACGPGQGEGKRSDALNEEPGDGASRAGNSQESVLAEIAREMVRIYKEQFGRGPTRARVDFAGPDIVICTLENSLTPVERRLADLGEHQRLGYQDLLPACHQAAVLRGDRTGAGRRSAPSSAALTPKWTSPRRSSIFIRRPRLGSARRPFSCRATLVVTLRPSGSHLLLLARGSDRRGAIWRPSWTSRAFVPRSRTG